MALQKKKLLFITTGVITGGQGASEVNQKFPFARPLRNETDSFNEIQTAKKDSQELQSPLAGSEKIQ